jgi:hypothetical protein
MCEGCAHCSQPGPGIILECQICIRNPANASKVFQPIVYKGQAITNPVDMFISPFLLAIFSGELAAAYSRGVMDGMGRNQNPPIPDYPHWGPHGPPWRPYYSWTRRVKNELSSQ